MRRYWLSSSCRRANLSITVLLEWIEASPGPRRYPFTPSSCPWVRRLPISPQSHPKNPREPNAPSSRRPLWTIMAALVLRIKFPPTYPLIYKTLRVDAKFTSKEAVKFIADTVNVTSLLQGSEGLYIPDEKRWLDDATPLTAYESLQDVVRTFFRCWTSKFFHLARGVLLFSALPWAHLQPNLPFVSTPSFCNLDENNWDFGHILGGERRCLEIGCGMLSRFQ